MNRSNALRGVSLQFKVTGTKSHAGKLERIIAANLSKIAAEILPVRSEWKVRLLRGGTATK